MNNYLFLLLGYLLIFFSIIFVYFRLQKISLTREDNLYWLKIKKRVNSLRDKLFNLIKISEKEVFFILRNFWGKILLRIKIEALKIESWANKKLEELKNKEE